MTGRLQLMLCASALVLAPCAAANAADASAPPAVDPSAAQGGSPTVAEVVVTVQKREQLLQNVPATATAITGATLSQAGVVDMRGVTTLAPALSIVQTVGPLNQSYRLRGMGSDANIPTFEPDVALFVDGVYMARSGLSVDDLVDVARVEVVEGPQSTLYGKNATAGIVNVITAAPSNAYHASLEGSYSDLDGGLQAGVFRVAGSVSGPLNDRLRFRISAVSYNQGDSYKNLEPGAPNANDLNRYSVRAELDADLWADSDLRLTYSRSQIYNTRDGDADNFYYTTSPANNYFKLVSALGPHFGLSVCPDNDPNDRIICTTSPWNNSSFSDVASATLTTKIGRDTLTAITAASDYGVRDQNSDIAQVLLPIVAYDDNQKGGTYSQEIRLASPSGDKLEWLAGGYFEHSNFGRGDGGRTPTFVIGAAGPFVPLPNTPPALHLTVGQVGDEGFLNSKESSNYFGIFGQFTYHVTDRLELSGGLRGQTEAKRATLDDSYVVAANTPMLALNACGPAPVDLIATVLTPPGCAAAPNNGSFAHTTDYLTWNATADFHVTADAMLYATVSRGGKSFGYNIGFGNTPAADRQFKDEFVMNYEVGVKSSLFDGRARVAASAYYARETNYQDATFVGLQFLVNNAELVSVKGVEANGAVSLGQGLTANAGMSYTDAEFNKYTQGPCYYGEVPNNGTYCNLTGQSLPLTPKWRANAGLQYERPTPVGALYGRLDWVWQSSMLADSNLDPRSLQGEYSLVNLRLGLKLGHGLDVAVWGNNVFNTTYSQADYVSNLFGVGDPAFQRYLGRPREYGLTVKESF